MFGIGSGELMIIILIALLAVGPKGMTRLLRDLSRLTLTLRRHYYDFRHQVEHELRLDEMRELDQLRRDPLGYRPKSQPQKPKPESKPEPIPQPADERAEDSPEK
ncbi:MAG: hypothetical protein P9M14_00915 [Candidatus Alcyoniella australis]|nr:hypothetical protein [Candidatus Alcyoniella australis]